MKLSLIRYIYFHLKFKNKLIFPISCTIGRDSFFEGANRLHKDTWFSGYMGYGSYIGANSSVSNIKIGRYTSIGPWFKVITGVHPYSYPFATTCPMFFSCFKQNGHTFALKQKFKEEVFADGKYSVVIGNDVWINSNVSIISGTKIGDGAVILSGAVVNKDVPPYSIVGGVPAKLIKFRFSEDDINFLMSTKWWDKDIKWLEQNWELLCDIETMKLIL